MISCVFVKLKGLFLGILSLFRRALCFSRRRGQSPETADEVLQAVSVVTTHRGSRTKSEHPERDWNTWDDSPRTVEEHIEVYRQRLARTEQKNEMREPDIDFFGDMEPKVVKQTKVLIRTDNEPEKKFSRLTATTDATIPYAAELEDWLDESKSGWEEVNEDASKLIREKRREQRAQQKMQRHKDVSTNQGFAERIGNRKT
uniref:Putative receptor-binding cancer antigen n=1 Tax=Lutzomyia longipalpis TaxID=7200 RepID=A0A7G3AYZ9_LUTLO